MRPTARTLVRQVRLPCLSRPNRRASPSRVAFRTQSGGHLKAGSAASDARGLPHPAPARPVATPPKPPADSPATCLCTHRQGRAWGTARNAQKSLGERREGGWTAPTTRGSRLFSTATRPPSPKATDSAARRHGAKGTVPHPTAVRMEEARRTKQPSIHSRPLVTTHCSGAAGVPLEQGHSAEGWGGQGGHATQSPESVPRVRLGDMHSLSQPGPLRQGRTAASDTQVLTVPT